MKLAKRISIALLVACVVGGSAFAMAACGGGSTPEPTPTPSSEPTPVVSQEVSEPDDNIEISTPETPEVSTDVGDYARKTISMNGEAFTFGGAYGSDYLYLDGYDAVSFSAAFQDVGNILGEEGWVYNAQENQREDRTSWQSTEEGLNSVITGDVDYLQPDLSLLTEGEQDVGIIKEFRWTETVVTDSGEDYVEHKAVLALYLGYDASDISLHVYKLVLQSDDSDGAVVFQGEEAHNKMIELLKEVVEQ